MPKKISENSWASSSKTKSSSALKTSKKESGSQKRAVTPFTLYQDVANPNVSEGLESIVNLLQGRKNIVVLTGAGISVSCGLPDFRSRGSGLYSTLDTEDLGLSCPEELFDWEVFKEDPAPFYKFARNLYFPFGNRERARPSDSHKLLALLEQRGMLRRCYSQNIDGLEEIAGVSTKKLVYAHGSLQWATCCKCRAKVSAKEIESAVLERTVPHCQAQSASSRRNRAQLPKASSIQRSSSASSDSSASNCSPPKEMLLSTRSRKRPRPDPYDSSGSAGAFTCNGVLKPDITFFGEALNDSVRKSLESDRKKVDALIVIGTSLSVAPMSKVIGYLPANIPRILINRTIAHPKTSHLERDSENVSDDNDTDGDRVGDEEREFRNDYIFDAYLLGFCDDVTRFLAKRLFATPDKVKDNRKKKSSMYEPKETHCQLLATLRMNHPEKSDLGKADNSDDDEDGQLEMFKAKDWEFCKVPAERVVLFPGAESSHGNGYGDDGEEDANSEVTFREVAHCDGCSKRIVGTILKCVDCFDYDLCQKCFPKLSKSHYDGKHVFEKEAAAVVRR